MRFLSERSLWISVCLFALFGTTVAVTDLYVPSLPAIAHFFHTGPEAAQRSLTSFFFGVMFSPFLYGPLSERFGRKPPLCIGLFLASCASLWGYFATSIEDLILARALQGIGCGAGFCLSRVILRDAFEGKAFAKMTSYLGLASSTAIGLAPVIGGFLQVSFGWQANFFLMTLLLSSIFLLVIFRLPETHPEPQADALNFKRVLSSVIVPLTHKTFLIYTTSSALAFSGLITYVTLGPFLFQEDLGLSAEQFGLLALFIAIAQAISFTINGRFLVSRFEATRIMQTATLMMLLSGVTILLLHFFNCISVASLIIAVMFYTLSLGFVYSNAYVSALAPLKKDLGMAAGLYGSAQMSFGFLISGALSMLPQPSAFYMGIVFVSIAVLISCLLFGRSPK